jgi:hypothetical protein
MILDTAERAKKEDFMLLSSDEDHANMVRQDKTIIEEGI